MCLLRKITYGEFSEFVREKKITYSVDSYLLIHGIVAKNEKKSLKKILHKNFQNFLINTHDFSGFLKKYIFTFYTDELKKSEFFNFFLNFINYTIFIDKSKIIKFSIF